MKTDWPICKRIKIKPFNTNILAVTTETIFPLIWGSVHFYNLLEGQFDVIKNFNVCFLDQVILLLGV